MGRDVRVRSSTHGDRAWLLRASWAPELIGRQYHWLETPLQLVIGPLRAVGWPAGPSCVIEVDGRPAGYVGRNPLSGNLEYWLEPWARGGTGGRAIEAFCAWWRTSGDRPRAFFVAHHNERSRDALLGALARLGWEEGVDWALTDGRFGWRVEVRPAQVSSTGTA